MYDRRLDDQILSFELWPGLERGALVMRDRQTGTLWSQLTGMALEGRLAGRDLSLIPTSVQPLASWQRLHPGTQVLSSDTGSPFVDSEYLLGKAPREHERFVLGTRVGAAGRGYPLTFLDRNPILNDQLAGVPIVVAYDPIEGAGLVWDRRVRDRVLTFHPGQSAFSATDDAGDAWDLMRGIALSGPLAGQSLTPRWTTLAYVQNWQKFFGPGSIWRSP